MKLNRLNAPVLFAAMILLLAAFPAHAEMMLYDGIGLAAQVKFHGEGLYADGKTVWAGQYRITFQDAPYNAYCVDADQTSGSSEVTVAGLDVLRNGDLVGFLYETYADSVQTGADAGALAVAIWEVLYETDDTFDAGEGYFHITNNSSVRNAANLLLETLPDAYDPNMKLAVLCSDRHQDMLIATAGEIPEPATLCLFMAGGVLASIRRSGV